MFFPSQGSIRLGRLFGIEFSIHWMFLFFVGLLTPSSHSLKLGPGYPIPKEEIAMDKVSFDLYYDYN